MPWGQEYFPISSDFSDPVDLVISIFFLEQIFTIGIILNEIAKTKSVKIYQLHAKGYHINKNNEGTLRVSWQFSFVFGCGLSASAGNLLKLFSHYCKNWPMQVICCAGKWAEITVTLVFVFSILFSLHSCGYDKENLFDNQKLLKLVIIFLILMTFTFDSRVIL